MAELLQGERLSALLDRLPARPGVYLMKGAAGEVLYVGKAKVLRARVRNYFRASGDTRAFVSWLDRVLCDIEFVLTPSEKDALILERELIARYRPRFNINLRDDKNFLSIRLSDHPIPRLTVDRQHPGTQTEEQKRGQWFGPYTSAAAARETFGFVQRTFQLRLCSDTVFSHRNRPCLQHQIGRCLGPCTLPLPPGLYATRVEQAASFLRGRTGELVDRLRSQMTAAASEWRYEEAARLRDLIHSLEASLAKQRVVEEGGADLDVAGFHREGAGGVLLLLQVRRGRWIGTARFPFSGIEAPAADVLRQFLGQHYSSGAEVPPEILVPPEALDGGEEDGDLPLLADWLMEMSLGKVKVWMPQRGKAAELIAMARDNAAEAFRARLATTSALSDRLERLRQKLGLNRFPHRIECFDLSTLGGSFSVGAMAVLLEGEANPPSYRRYRIREAAPDSDVAMMREVIGRRFRPVLEETEDGPDLVVLDGGLQQLHVAEAVLADLGVSDVDLVALTKGGEGAGRHRVTRERVFVPGRKNPILLKPESDELFLLSRVRDEAHRFAGAYHRTLRKKATLHSLLDEIPGVGPVLRRRLLSRFGSLKGVRAATVGDLAAVAGVSRTLAERIHSFLQPPAEDVESSRGNGSLDL